MTRFYFSNAIPEAEGAWCRVMEIDLPGSILQYGAKEIEIKPRTLRMFHTVPEGLQGQDLIAVDQGLVAFGHDMVLQSVGQDVTVFMTLSPPIT